MHIALDTGTCCCFCMVIDDYISHCCWLLLATVAYAWLLMVSDLSHLCCRTTILVVVVCPTHLFIQLQVDIRL